MFYKLISENKGDKAIFFFFPTRHLNKNIACYIVIERLLSKYSDQARKT